MSEEPRRSPCLDLFWEEADLIASGEHPLRRELAHRVDVLARYEKLIAEAQGNGQDDLLTNLTAQHRRELRVIEALQAALEGRDPDDDADRTRGDDAGDDRRPLSSDPRTE